MGSTLDTRRCGCGQRPSCCPVSGRQCEPNPNTGFRHPALSGEDETCCSHSTGPSAHGTGRGLGSRLQAAPPSLARLQPAHWAIAPNRPLLVRPGPYLPVTDPLADSVSPWVWLR